VGHSLHGGHVDHVKDLVEVILHAKVVKNPDLVLFGKFKQRNSYDKSARQIHIEVLGKLIYCMYKFCFVCSSRP
jgi:hypothetical protein